MEAILYSKKQQNLAKEEWNAQIHRMNTKFSKGSDFTCHLSSKY